MLPSLGSYRVKESPLLSLIIRLGLAGCCETWDPMDEHLLQEKDGSRVSQKRRDLGHPAFCVMRWWREKSARVRDRTGTLESGRCLAAGPAYNRLCSRAPRLAPKTGARTWGTRPNFWVQAIGK